MFRLIKLWLATFIAYRALKFARDNIEAAYRVAEQRARERKIYIEPDADKIFTLLYCDGCDALALRSPVAASVQSQRVLLIERPGEPAIASTLDREPENKTKRDVHH